MAYLGSFFADLVLILVILVTSYVVYMKYKFQYWIRNKISQLNPSIPFGDTKKIILKQESVATVFQKIHQEFKSMNVPFGGIYFLHLPELFILDVDIIKQILVKDFQYFNERGTFSDEENDPLTAHLFNLEGQKWKHLRMKLTPTFTSGKMKMMFNTLVACSDELNNILADVHSKSEAVDIKDILARFTTDVIGSCAFGIDCNSLKDPNTDFRKFGQLTFEPERFIDKAKAIASFLFPNFFRYFKIKALNEDISDFFMNVVKTTVKYREDNNIKREDFLHLLIQLKNHGELKDDSVNISKGAGNEIGGITIEQIAAQCFLFFIAGFETSSTTMTFCLYELVKNPEIQEKLREEIKSVLKKHDGKLTYEAIMEMHYMEKVINETLRKYPPLAFLNRLCTKEYKLPKSNYMIPKGELIRISILGLHRDPEYYPDPEKFDPERFSPEEKAKRPACTFMPFGEGPRNCIGLRFGLMQTKVGLSVILKNYRFTLNKKTTDPLLMDPNNIIMSTKGGIWLNAHKV